MNQTESIIDELITAAKWCENNAIPPLRYPIYSRWNPVYWVRRFFHLPVTEDMYVGVIHPENDTPEIRERLRASGIKVMRYETE